MLVSAVAHLIYCGQQSFLITRELMFETQQYAKKRIDSASCLSLYSEFGLPLRDKA
jgi:hypothetical protein